MTVVAIAGWGRFGAALGSLLLEAGVAVRAYDPFAAVPDEVRVDDLAALPLGADTVVIAVPVPRMEEVMGRLRPALTPAQVVVDVGSVKVKPEEAMRRVFGADIPWVATHPLFGPTSLALAERPLRVVVCPNPLHPAATAHARALYERIGCLILEQDAHTHDRAMAETHALAFFVAKGFVDAGVGMDVAYAPPSFQAIARTVDVVRSDAGHLFAAIQRENPYAVEARRRLLDAMGAVDRRLGDQATEEEEEKAMGGAGAPTRLSIPDLGAQSPVLQEARQHIDAIDRELVELLARRAELAQRAARAKAAMGHGVTDPGREAALLEARRAWALDRGLDAESIDDVFRSILRFSRRLQGARRPPGGDKGPAKE